MKQQHLRHRPAPSVKDPTPSVLQATARLQRQMAQGGDPAVNIHLLLQAICVQWDIPKASLVDTTLTPPAVLYTFPHPSQIPALGPQTHPISLKRRAKAHLPHTVFDLRHKQGRPTVQLILEGSVPDHASDEIDVASSALDLALAWKKADPNDIGPLRRAFENSEDGFWEWDFQSGNVIFSDRDAEMLGYTQDEIPKRIENCMELYHPEDLAQGQALLAEHAAGKLPLVDTRLRMRHKDGHWVWIRTRAKIVERDPVTGEPWRVVGADTDVTRQVEMEDELEKLAMVVRATSNAVVLRDRNFKIEWVNDSFTRICGYTLEEVKGNFGLWKLEDPQGAPDAVGKLNARVLAGERVSADLCMTDRRGEPHAIRVEVGPIRNARGELVGYASIGQDVTERKRAEEALAASEERLRLAFEVTKDAVWDYDVVTDRAIGTQRLPLMLGFPETEFEYTFEQWKQCCHPDDLERATKAWLDLFSIHGPGVAEIKSRSRHQDGHYIWTHTRAKVVAWDAEGNPLRIVGATSDISHEKQMEEELEKLALVVRTTSNAVVLRDRNFKIEWVNDSFTRITGYTLEEVKGNFGFWKLEDPQGDPDAVAQLTERALAGERAAADLCMTNTRGERRTLRIEIGPIRNARGELVGYASIGQDITQRKRAEEALAKSEERLRLAFESTLDAFWDLNMETGALFSSPRMLEILGRSEGSLAFTHEEWVRNCHPDDLPRMLEERQHYFSKGGQDFAEFKYRCKHGDGHWIWIRTRSKVVLRDAEGVPLRIVGAMSDITREKEMEEELEKLAMVVRTTSNAVLLRDRNFNLEWVNKACEHLTGYSLDEVRGKSDFMFLADPPKDPGAIQKMGERLRTGELVVSEARLRRKSGEIRLVRFEAAPIVGRDGEIVGYMSIGQDITEQVLAEESRLKMEERMMMSQRLESVGVLAGGIAHDFNNILMGVLLEASVVREEVTEGTALWESLKTIEVSASRMKELVNQLLAFAGKGRFVVERVDPDALVKDTLSLISRNIHKDAELVVDMSPERATIEIDPSQLRQVVMNLVINASDALEGRAGRISVVTAKTEKNWALWVEDTGKGISEEAKGRIFDPFYTTKAKGRGLGLSTVHGVVRRAKGEIEVDSKVGEGTIFRVRIPLSG